MATTTELKSGLTAERLRKILDYDSESGEFRWREKISCKVVVGKLAGGFQQGYISISIEGYKYRAHRLAWLYVHGEWPPEDIDHIDLVKCHNWISNLRLASRSQNIANRGALRTNKSGFKGVYLAQEKYWRAMIWKNGRETHIGYYDTAEEAHAAYSTAAEEMFGEFANDGLER